MFNQDKFMLKSVELGELLLKSNIHQESRGIVQNSCNGLLTANVFLGKAGVGKSTIASLASSRPGLFDVGTSGQGTTTLGTWLSSSEPGAFYAAFSDKEFKPDESLPENIPLLQNLQKFYESGYNLVWFDTEGMDYQTELGNNFDIITVLPHALMSENVFFMVRDRVNPAEIIEFIDRLGQAALKTEGTLAHRAGKLFGRFHIIVNKAQDISKSDEEELELLKINNPSLFTKVHTFFNYGPELVMLPRLEWDYTVKPDFNEDGFFINYDHVRSAHPPLRDRMFYGLHKLASYVLFGTEIDESYSIKCETFENMLEDVYEATTEEIVDINQLDYDWLLKEAKLELSLFVSQFNMTDIGLTTQVTTDVCPEADNQLQNCIQKTAKDLVNVFYDECVSEAQRLFPKGEKDLIKYLNEDLFPLYVTGPVNIWFETCSLLFTSTEMYSDQFINTFTNSMFFSECQRFVSGKLIWNNWESCSKSCAIDGVCGVRVRIAVECVPSFALCTEMQVQREDCSCESLGSTCLTPAP